MNAGFSDAVEEESLFLAIRFVENDETAGSLRGLDFRRTGGHLHRFGETRPLAQVTRGVEISHPRRVVRICSTFFIPQIEKTMFLVEISLVEEHEETAQDVVIFDLLLVRHPAVAQALQDETHAMHLAIRARRATKGPAQSVGSHQIGHHLDVFFGVGPQRRQLAVTHSAVGVQLQRGADEHKRHDSVEIVISA